MLAETETDPPAQLSADGASVPEPESDGKAEGPAETPAESVSSMVVSSRQSIDAIGLMADNLRVFLQSKGSD